MAAALTNVLLKRSMEHFLFSFLSKGKNNEWYLQHEKGVLRFSISFLIDKRGFSIFKIAQYRNVNDGWLITKRN
jgi:hypothetical protein